MNRRILISGAAAAPVLAAPAIAQTHPELRWLRVWPCMLQSSRWTRAYRRI